MCLSWWIIPYIEELWSCFNTRGQLLTTLKAQLRVMSSSFASVQSVNYVLELLTEISPL